MKVFEILKYFLTEKMDDLTQQLFNDVQKEENQRMYVIWILFLWNSLRVFSFSTFLSTSANVLCWHHLNLSMFLGINAGTEVLRAEFRKSTFLFVGESCAGNYTETVLLQFPVFSCVFLRTERQLWSYWFLWRYPPNLVRTGRAADGHTSQNSCEVNMKGQNWKIQHEAVFVKDIWLRI